MSLLTELGNFCQKIFYKYAAYGAELIPPPDFRPAKNCPANPVARNS
jgi:hypothetical protein